MASLIDDTTDTAADVVDAASDVTAELIDAAGEMAAELVEGAGGATALAAGGARLVLGASRRTKVVLVAMAVLAIASLGYRKWRSGGGDPTENSR